MKVDSGQRAEDPEILLLDALQQHHDWSLWPARLKKSFVASGVQSCVAVHTGLQLYFDPMYLQHDSRWSTIA